MVESIKWDSKEGRRIENLKKERKKRSKAKREAEKEVEVQKEEEVVVLEPKSVESEGVNPSPSDSVDPEIEAQQRRYIEEYNRRVAVDQSVKGVKKSIYRDYPELEKNTTPEKKVYLSEESKASLPSENGSVIPENASFDSENFSPIKNKIVSEVQPVEKPKVNVLSNNFLGESATALSYYSNRYGQRGNDQDNLGYAVAGFGLGFASRAVSTVKFAGDLINPATTVQTVVDTGKGLASLPSQGRQIGQQIKVNPYGSAGAVAFDLSLIYAGSRIGESPVPPRNTRVQKLVDPQRIGSSYNYVDKNIKTIQTGETSVTIKNTGQRTLTGEIADPSKLPQKPKSSPLGLPEEAYQKYLDPFKIEEYKTGSINKPKGNDITFDSAFRERQTTIGKDPKLRIQDKQTGAEFDISKRDFEAGLKEGTIDPYKNKIVAEYYPDTSTKYLRSDLIPAQRFIEKGVNQISAKYSPKNRIVRDFSSAEKYIDKYNKYIDGSSTVSPVSYSSFSVSSVQPSMISAETQSPKIITESSSAVNQKSFIEEESKIDSKIESKTITQPKIKESIVIEPRFDYRSEGQQKTRQSSEQVLREETIVAPVLSQVIQPKTKIAFEQTPQQQRPIFPRPPRVEPREDPSAESFRVFVRRRGIFREEGVFESQEEAFRKGRDAVDFGSPASFKVEREGGGNVNIPLSNSFLKNRFRKSKKDSNVFVEKNKYRINTAGEKTEITYKGVFSSKNKKKSKREKFNLWG